MSAFRARPIRRFRSELASIASVLLIAGSLAMIFPRESVLFSSEDLAPKVRPVAENAADGACCCAFVTLDAATAEAALAAARTSWQADARLIRRTAELLPSVLPEARPALVAERTCERCARTDGRVCPRADLVPPTSAAARPARIRPDADGPAPLPFPREVLLRIE